MCFLQCNVVPSLELFFMGLFVFNIFHMYLAGATGYGIYTTIFSHFLNDDMQNYGRQLTLTRLDLAHFNFGEYVGNDFLHSMMLVAMKQVYGYVIWFALAIAAIFCFATFQPSAPTFARCQDGRSMPSNILQERNRRN